MILQRRQLVVEQQRLVNKIVSEPFEETVSDQRVLMWIDTRALRGLPAIGRSVAGVVTESYVPGSDEHLDAMSA